MLELLRSDLHGLGDGAVFEEVSDGCVHQLVVAGHAEELLELLRGDLHGLHDHVLGGGVALEELAEGHVEDTVLGLLGVER